MTKVTGRVGMQQFRTEIRSDSGHLIIADEPESLGGQNLGMEPYELLSAGLVACTCATLRMYIDRKGWNLPEVKVGVELDRDESRNLTRFIRTIEVPGFEDEDIKKRLLDIANKCPVHKVLTGSIAVDTSLV
jgi:putative redox protein